MKNFIIFLIALALAVACSTYYPLNNIHELQEKAYYNLNNKDSIYRVINEEGHMYFYLRAYINRYYNVPPNIDFLIHAFDKTDYKDEIKEANLKQYELMEHYRDDLKLYIGDSIVAIFYKRIIPSNIVTLIYKEPYYDYGAGVNIFDILPSCFDREGYLIYTEELSHQLRGEYRSIAQNYHENGWKRDSSNFPDYMFMQYSIDKDELINVITNVPLIDKSPFFKDIKYFMRDICKKYGFSRMVIPSWIPKDVTL